MEIHSLSFGSTFKIPFKFNNWHKGNELLSISPHMFDKSAKMYMGYDGKGLCKTFVINDKADKQFETFLNSRFINFIKRTNAYLFSEHPIRMRMRIRPDSSDRYLPNLVELKTKEFDKMFKETSPWQYIGDYASMNNKERYDGFRNYIKTNFPIDAPEVYIKDIAGMPEIVFQDGRHRYAFLRDMGFQSIPVATDKSSYDTAVKFGLIKQ